MCLWVLMRVFGGVFGRFEFSKCEILIWCFLIHRLICLSTGRVSAQRFRTRNRHPTDTSNGVFIWCYWVALPRSLPHFTYANIIKKHLTVREYFKPYPARRERVGIRLLNFQHPVDTYSQHFLEQADFNYMPLV